MAAVPILIAFSIVYASTAGPPGGRRVTIAPGVVMPVISNGYVSYDIQAQANATETWLRAGGRGIDTAHGYHNQVGVGKGIINSGIAREEIFVTTKIPCAGTAEKALELVKDDIKQLGTYADLVIIHGVGDVKPMCYGNPGDIFCEDAYNSSSAKCCQTIEEIQATYHGLELALEQKLVKAIGVSNFQPSHLEGLLKTAKTKPAVNQAQMYVGHHDDSTLKYCREQQIQYMAYSPLGVNGISPKAVIVNPVVQKVAQARNVTAAQIGLAWVLRQGAVLTTATSSAKHSLEDLNSDSITNQLTAAELDILNSVQCKLDEPKYATVTCTPNGAQVMQCEWPSKDAMFFA